MITKLSQVLEQVEDEGLRTRLAYRLHSKPFGGWRGLFDPFCSEWKNTEVDEKIQFIGELVRASGVRLHAMVELYQSAYNEKSRPDIANVTEHALCDLLEWSILIGGKKKKALRK